MASNINEILQYSKRSGYGYGPVSVIILAMGTASVAAVKVNI